MRLKSILPRSLYGRAALILIVPIVTIQLVVSITFIQRHFERVTEQMTEGVLREVRLILDEADAADSQEDAISSIAKLARPLGLIVQLPAAPLLVDQDSSVFWDLSGRVVISTLRADLPDLEPIDLTSGKSEVRLRHPTKWGDISITIDRRRVSASNPHQLLVLMIVTSILMTMIAFLFLSNQLRPIKLLSEAAEAFGKGRVIPYRPRGALEVRSAGHAFLDMRGRIERQIEQRTMMLSGVSHDLRTPLTRLRLGLSLLPDDEETRALLADVSDMERLVDEFLSFARGDAMEDAEIADPLQLVQRAVENAQRAGLPVTLGTCEGHGDARLRTQSVMRALENLIGNAVRFGTRAEVSVAITERSLRLTVEDDGPGIPRELRDEALAPFTRLDAARDPNRGGGVGLGLSIASDIARSHGGSLRLDQSERLGGLRADLILAR
jgi:two-component system, OmpR family, osmolarity sensor histidine kinase EnvZ